MNRGEQFIQFMIVAAIACALVVTAIAIVSALTL
jgi:hypothetical protein